MENKNSGFEQRGIEIVPAGERTRGFWDIFWVWGGFSIVMTNFLLAALSVSIGIIPAILMNALGITFISIIVLLGTKIGSKHGIAGTVAMRSAFGINGRYIASVLMIVVGIGWFGIQTGIIGESVYAVMSEISPSLAFSPKIWMVITGILMAAVTIYGYKAIVWLNRLAMPVLLIIFGLLIYQIITVYSDQLASFQPTNDISFFAAINFLPGAMAAALILSMDYGRYAKPGKTAIAAPISLFIFFNLLAIIGVISAAVAGTWDPVQILVELGLGVPGLLMLILAAWTTNVSNIYVASLAISNITGLSRVSTAIIASVLGITVAVGGIYSLEGIEGFVTIITAFLIPTSGVLIVDYYMRNNKKILVNELFKNEDSAYWYTKGWNIQALIAWALGAIYTFVAPDQWVPAITSMVVAGVVYYILTINTKSVVSNFEQEEKVN